MQGTPSHSIRIRVDQVERLIMFDYEPGSDDALFDICDNEGHILKTGDVHGPVTQVQLTDVLGDELILMVLDGESSMVRSLDLRMAV